MRKFSIRSLLLATAIVAALIGAVARLRYQIEAERSAVVRLEAANCNLVSSRGTFAEHVTELEIHFLDAIEGYNPVADLRFLPSLKRLSITPMYATEEQISGLQNATPDLQHLTLQGKEFRGRMLSWLSRFPRLKTLRVEVDATHQELGLLRQFRDLTELEISASGFGDAHLSSLSSLTKLKSLKLDSTCLTGKTLDTMNGMDQLETLQILNDVPDEPIDAGLAELLSAINRERGVDQTDIAKTYVNLNVDEIPVFPSLTYLGLQKCELDHSSISRIASLPCLVSISFSNCVFPPDVSLSELTKLRSVSFNNCQPIHRLIGSASELSSLESLCIEDSHLGFDDLVPLASATRLESLTLTDLRNDGGCKRLSRFPSLKNLTLWGTSLSAVEKKCLSSISSVKVYDL